MAKFAQRTRQSTPISVCYDRRLPMTPERWRQTEEIYSRALELEPDRRRVFLDDACKGDPELRQEVESMLAVTGKAPRTLDHPAMDLVARSLANEQPTMQSGDTFAMFPDLGERYLVLDEAGRGGMGIVYKVRDRVTGMVVAAKVLHPDIASNEMMVELFKSELKVSLSVTHRNVCRIYDLGQAGDTRFISMEFVEGESLRRLLNRVGALTFKKGVEIIRQICEGLREAHHKGIIHRDMKPENVMVDNTGNVKVMDFGIARVLGSTRTLTRGIAGTPCYMSPEQLNAAQLDVRSDIYSMGLVAYEIFTGSSAFAGTNPVAVASQMLNQSPPLPRTIAPSIPPEVEAFILRCIEKDPALRYQTLDEALLALPQPGVTTAPTLLPRPPKSKISRLFDESVQIMEPKRARPLLIVIQLGYLVLYVAALYHMGAAMNTLVASMGLSPELAMALPFLAIGGIALRLYLLSALTFNHPETGKQYWRLFPYLLAFDEIWAASPLLLQDHLRIGVALAMSAAMVYLPFSQKTLFSNAYR